jgi:undecaprenyl diphosphate synthase
VSRDSEDSAIPYHVGIIMDGNGRWAQARGLPRVAGHHAGVQTVRRMVEACSELGIRVLTLYTFSTENWRRPEAEVAYLMQLAEEYARRELPELHRTGVRFRLMGRREGLPHSLVSVLDEAARQTQNNDRMILNLALNYGGRAEIVDAARSIIAAHRRGRLDAAALDEATFAHYLYCSDLPDADLIIRTGGERRLSNFLLWRAVEAVFWSTPTMWPDFQRGHLLQAVQAYGEESGEQPSPHAEHADSKQWRYSVSDDKVGQ